MIFITPVTLSSFSTDGTFSNTKDVSSYVSANATGILFRLYRVSGSSNSIYIRKDSSSDYIGLDYLEGVSQYGITAISSSKTFQNSAYDDGGMRMDILGYFEDDAVFFSTFIDKLPGTLGSYQDISIASDTGSNTAQAGIFFIDNIDEAFGIRKNGSSDDRKREVRYGSVMIMGVDSNEVLEAYVNTADDNGHIYLIGYIKNGIVWNTNATNISLSSTGSYTDLSALASGAWGSITRVIDINDDPHDLSAVLSFGLRKNGSSYDPYRKLPNGQVQVWTQCDTSGVIEGKISSTECDFYLEGYFKSPSTDTNSARSAKITGTLGTYSERSASIKSDGIYDARSAKITGKSTYNSERSARVTDGTNRGNYGIKVTKPGYDVKTETDIKNMIFTSARGVLGLRRVREYTSTTDANGDISLTVYHNFGYVPIVIAKTTTYDGKEVTINPTDWHYFYQTGDKELVEVTEYFDFNLTSTSFTMVVHAEAYNHDTWVGWNVSGRSYTFKVYYYFNEVTDQ